MDALASIPGLHTGLKIPAQFSLFPEDSLLVPKDRTSSHLKTSLFFIELISPEAFVPPEDFPFSLGFLFFLMTFSLCLKLALPT
jgi:hypothetical protein